MQKLNEAINPYLAIQRKLAAITKTAGQNSAQEQLQNTAGASAAALSSAASNSSFWSASQSAQAQSSSSLSSSAPSLAIAGGRE